MNQQQPVHYNYEEDEIDLKELLAVIIREKKIVFKTFIFIFLCSLLAALYNRSISREALTILRVDNSGVYGEIDLMPNSVLEKVYSENNIKEREHISLDGFKNKFKIEGIIPETIKIKKQYLEKNGETLNYIPKDYIVELRVGSIDESRKILKDYYKELNEELAYKNGSRYRFKKMNLNLLSDENYDYQDYLDIINERKKALKEEIKNKRSKKLDYISYGFGYRDALNGLVNLEEINIDELQNYLDATKIVRNLEIYNSSYLNRIETLKNQLNLKKGQRGDYKKILNNLKDDNGDLVVPQGLKVEVNDSSREIYYMNVMKEYMEIEKDIEELTNQIERLEEKNKGVRVADKQEEGYIISSLKGIFEEYNKVIDLVNELEAQKNNIEYGEIVQKISPIVVVSNSKAKIIVMIGFIMGIFMGIVMAFIKNYFRDLKRYIPLVFIFFLIGIKGYANEKLVFSITHKEIKRDENPDKTPFDLKKEIIDYIEKDMKLENYNENNITIEPIADKYGYLKVKEKLEKGEDIRYVPTEYMVIIKDKENEKEIANNLRKNFSNYYIDRFFQANRYGLAINDRETYRKRLVEMNNRLNSIQEYITGRKNLGISREKSNEYKNMELEIWRIKNTEYRDLKTYLNSKKIVVNVDIEKIVLAGERENIERTLKNRNEMAKVYEKILQNYSLKKKSNAIISNDGSIVISNKSGVKEKQYIEISSKYTEVLDSINILNKKLMENENLFQNMRVPTEKEREYIEKKFKILEKDINDLNSNMKKIELRDYKKEYSGSVKVF